MNAVGPRRLMRPSSYSSTRGVPFMLAGAVSHWAADTTHALLLLLPLGLQHFSLNVGAVERPGVCVIRPAVEPIKGRHSAYGVSVKTRSAAWHPRLAAVRESLWH
jgi:hypothetical protein